MRKIHEIRQLLPGIHQGNTRQEVRVYKNESDGDKKGC